MRDIFEIYQILLARFGHQNWWPGETTDEIIIGAILTQSVNWKNVEKALSNLKENNLLNWEKLAAASPEEIAPLIKPTIYYNVKAQKLKNFSQFLNQEFSGYLERMFQTELSLLRPALLSVKGIGEETADSILLYAGNKQSFVVDAYTKRIFQRLGFTDKKMNYADLQKFIAEKIPDDLDIYQDFHAQLVQLGKDFCKPKPKCSGCPLGDICGKRIE